MPTIKLKEKKEMRLVEMTITENIALFVDKWFGRQGLNALEQVIKRVKNGDFQPKKVGKNNKFNKK